MNTDGMKDIAAISALLRDRDLSKVEGIVAQMRRIEAEAAAIREIRDRRLAQADLDAARLSGADPVWLAWAEERLTRSMAQLAQLRAGHEKALGAARRSFGRAEATAALAGLRRPGG